MRENNKTPALRGITVLSLPLSVPLSLSNSPYRNWNSSHVGLALVNLPPFFMLVSSVTEKRGTCLPFQGDSRPHNASLLFW